MSFAGGSSGGDAAAWFATPADMAAWADHAPVGETFTYARAAALPRDSKIAIAAADLKRRGIVELNLRREGGRLTYLLRRVRQRVEARPEPVRRMNGNDARLYRVLSDLAEAGKPCPVNGQLARLANLKNGQQASYHLTRLIQLGKIERDALPDGGRVIRILSTGETTEGSGE